jgi:hypothetical protein
MTTLVNSLQQLVRMRNLSSSNGFEDRLMWKFLDNPFYVLLLFFQFFNLSDEASTFQ